MKTTISLLLAAICLGSEAGPRSETPGVLWRESFDGDAPLLTPFHATVEHTVTRHAMVTDDGRSAEHLRLSYAAWSHPERDARDVWRVKGFRAVDLIDTTGIRLTVKSAWPVRVTYTYGVKGRRFGGGGESAWTRGSGAWETVQVSGFLAKARAEVRTLAPGSDTLEAGDDTGDFVIRHVHIECVAPGREQDVLVDELVVVDTTVYRPEADLHALPFRVGWATTTTQAPTIDGRIEAADGWDRAPQLGDFHRLGDGRFERTEAWLLYDDAALYVAARLHGPAGDALKCDALADQNVYADDCVELFIGPPGAGDLQRRPEGQRYYHLLVNAAGTRADGIAAEGGGSWSGDWSARTAGRADGWDVEIRIPLATIGVAGAPTGVWRFNLARSYSDPTATGQQGHTTWSRLRTWFHEPQRFGRIVFGAGRPDGTALSGIVLREDLRTAAGAPRAGLERARRDLARVPADAAGRRAAFDRITALAAIVDGIDGRIDDLAPTDVLGQRAALLGEIDVVTTQAHAAQIAASIVRLGARTGLDRPFIVLGGPAITNERFEPGKPLPPSFDAVDGLAVSACRGEYEPATFVLYATEDRRGVHVRATELAGTAGTIPADAVDLYVVKYWFQAGDGIGSAARWRLAGGVLVPELLLKDDGLVTVDLERRRNHVRTADGLVDISDPAIVFNVKGHPIPGAETRLLHLLPRDADRLQPFDVAAGTIKQVHARILVPADAPAGTYEGRIHVEVPAAGSFSLPITLTVHPFDLAPPPIEYSIYVRGHVIDGTPRVAAWSEQKSEAQYRAEMAGLLAHGIANPQVAESSFEGFLRAMRIRESVGMPKGPIYNVRWGIPRDELDSDEAIEAFKVQVRRLVTWAADNGYGPYHVYAIDEEDSLLLQERRWIEAAHAVGARVFASVGQEGHFFDRAGDILDLPILAGPHNPDMARRVHEQGHRIGIYAFPQVGSELAEDYRRNYGIGLWQAGYDVAMTYAYQHAFGHIWNDFDNEEHKDHNFAYPADGGVIDTLSFEGFREAVDDSRYAATLMAVAEAALPDPARRARAEEARRWIQTVSTLGDLDALRREIVERILRLYGAQAASVPAGGGSDR